MGHLAGEMRFKVQKNSSFFSNEEMCYFSQLVFVFLTLIKLAKVILMCTKEWFSI